MTTGNLSPGSSGSPIDFGSSRPFPAEQVYKLKICEARDCGKQFTTLAMAPVKRCQQCRAREEAAQIAARVPIPDALAPEEIVQNWTSPRNRNAVETARHALSMREATQ